MPSAIGVSIIIPSFNSAAFLADALTSVSRQTYTEFECIVVDDGSTDDSRAIVQRYGASDPRFKLLALPDNRGAAAARNAGLYEAQGRWITLLDADDLFAADRLERLIGLGEKRQADMVVDDLVVTKFPDLTPLYRAFGFADAESEFTQEDYFRRSRVFGAALGAGYMQPLMRREFLDRSGARYDSSVPSGEDFLFYGDLFARRPRCVATNYAGYVYRRRPGSLSQTATHLHVHSKQSDRLLRDHDNNLSPESRDALAKRSHDFDRLALALPVLTALRTRQWFAAARFLAAHPTAIVTCMFLLRARIRRRSSSRFHPAAVSERQSPNQPTPNARN